MKRPDAVLHPMLPVAYANDTGCCRIDIFELGNGGIRKIRESVGILLEWQYSGNANAAEPGVILPHPDGKTLYAAVRGVDMVAVFSIDASGGLKLKQNIECGCGEPWDLKISADEAYLYVLGRDGGSTETFVIEDDGMLSSMGLAENMDKLLFSAIS